MRIVITGDLQYEEHESIGKIAEDILSLEPDYVICLGDYGRWETFGSYQAFYEIGKAFESLEEERLIPLLGNHDIQYEAGRGKFPHGTIRNNYQRAFGFFPKNRVLEFEQFKVICMHIDIQPQNDFHCFYECYISDVHFQQLCRELEKDPEKPAIIVTHAPPIGTDLINVPEIHLRASNAYLDQDHDYMRWYHLMSQYKQIIMWFSGHYHMGHWHTRSVVQENGITFCTTGSPTLAARDGQHHTRVLEVKGTSLQVFTYDHDRHMMCGDGDACPLRVRADIDRKKEKIVRFAAGCGKVVKEGLKFGKNGRVYAHTDNGYLWEIDLQIGAALGTLHYSKKYTLDEVITDDRYVWRICGKKAFGHRYGDPDRFMREYDYKDCRFITRDAAILMDKAKGKQEEHVEWEGRPCCRIGKNQIVISYNDAEGRLFFEILSLGEREKA